MRKRIAAIVFSVLAFFLSVIPQAYCLPQGQSVETGSATFDQPNSSTLIITAADKTVINFNSFSIAPNETVSFIQPSSTASVLSRVNSGISSVIAGFLNANGILFLVNSAGINFTPTAQVNVGSLVASTLAISTNNFIKGNYIFEHQDGAAYAQVLNEGRISADNVALIASAVNNTGIIAAKAGTVNLASGNKTTVSFDARGLIQVEVNSETSEKVLDSNGVSVKDAVANSGSITAREVYMTTKTALGVFESAVNQGGIVRASAITEEKGVIKLVGNEDIQISGTLDAGAGGSVDVLTSGNISVNSKLKTIGNSVLAAGKNIKLNADITTASGNLSLLADNNFDGLGSFLQIQGSTISTLDYGDITIQASGESTLANINSAGDLILKQAGAPVTFTQWPGSAVTTQGSLTINPGVTLTATDTNYNIGRDWRNLGNFIPGASTVNLTGPNNARIFGSNNFFNLIVDTPQKLVAVEPETTQAIINNLVLRGSFGKLLVIGSIDPTKQWSILPFGATDISYILLGDCVNIRGPPLKAIHSSSAGNLTNFDLDPYWTGQGQANNWSEPDNWDTGTIPTQFDTVTFDGVTGLNPNKDSIVDSAFQGTIDNLYINGYTGTITLARDLTLQGDFSHKTGSFDAATYPVIFIDASKPSNISGNTTFYNLTCVTPGKLLIFEAGSTQTINASFTLSGTSDNLIVLRSSSSYTQWIINNIGDTESVSCVDIQDANNIGSLITATNVIDSGNNSGFQLILIDPTLYRSVGTNSADLNTSPRTVTISGTTATFNGAMPDNVGVGDVLQYVISSTYYLAFITGRTSSTVYTVNNSSGGTPQAASAGQVVNVYRAYNSLANWQSQTVNTTIDSSVISSVNPSKGLVTAGTVMMVPCYADGLDTASVTITGWTTSATNYIQIYTPYQTSEVGASQRHSGVWDDTKYRLEVTGAYPISNLIGNIRIDGLQIKLTLTSGSAIYGAFYTNNATTAGTNYISNNIVVGVLSGTASTTRGIIGEANSSAVIMYVWNNVVYGFINGTTDEVGIRIGSGGSTTTMYAYNNTVSNCYVGINLGAGTLIAKNNLISSCATAASGTFAAGTDYNATNNSSMGYTVTDSGNIHDHLGQTFSFVNDTNKDFHLASNDAGATGYGVDLSATFTTDIHGQARSSGNWDIGADQAGAYWILGGTGNWSSTTNWSDSSGGPSGQVVPTSKTPVFFDANSGTGTATVDSAANALHLGCTGYTGTLALSAGLSIYGNLTLVSGMTFTPNTNTVTLTGTGASNTITSGGLSFYNLTQSGTASTDTYTLQDPLVVSHTLTLTTGTLDTKSTGSYAITVGSADPVNGNFDQSSITSKLLARSSLITLNGNGTFKADGTKDYTQYNSASLKLNGVNTLTYTHLTSSYENGFYNLTVGQSGNTTTISDYLTAISLLTVGSGTLSGGSNTLYLRGGTPLSFDAGSVVSIDSLGFQVPNQSIPSLTKGYDCNIRLYTSNQTITQTGDVKLNGTKSLYINGNGAEDRVQTWKTDGYNLTVGGTIYIGASADTGLKKLDATRHGDGIPANGGRTSTISVGGNWLNYGTTGTGLTPSQFIADNSTVILTGTGASNTITSGQTNSPFYNLTQNGTASTDTYTLQDALVVSHTL
ncbi:MAG: filamentous hemagglutinin N-terminal domain-containing protein, partial [Candidatus Omnitrophica bacterium]|nr:filamentous hemagglutinin N-terminal domain-containing protein [Candidatus Omnitrophota bacterium]